MISDIWILTVINPGSIGCLSDLNNPAGLWASVEINNVKINNLKNNIVTINTSRN